MSLEDTPAPLPGSGEILVSVRACGLNFPDVLLLHNAYQTKVPRPIIPGCEIAGVVEAVAPDVRDFARGDRIVGLCNSGGLAELATLNVQSAFKLPASVPFETGAGLVFTYGTAHHALFDRGRLVAGDRVLVLGAGGSIGLAMTELAVSADAVVTAAASDSRKLDLARAKGAAATLTYPRSVEPNQAATLSGIFKTFAGDHGFDIVVDPVGGAYCEPALRATAWGGRYLVVGFAASIPKIPLNLVLLKGCSVVGVEWGRYGQHDPEGRARSIKDLFAKVASCEIDAAPSSIVAFEQGAESLGHMQARMAAGKVVVRVTGP